MLAQAQTDEEKKSIEEKMTSDPELAGYLRALGATDKEDLVSEERSRRQQARQSRVAADIEAMDVDQSQVWWGSQLVRRVAVVIWKSPVFFFWTWFGAEIRPQSQSEFPLNFPKIAWKISQSKIWILKILKKKKIVSLLRYFFYVKLSCILFLQLIELAFIYCYNYLNTLNILPIWIIYWNEKFPKILVLSLICPIPSPKVMKKTLVSVLNEFRDLYFTTCCDSLFLQGLKVSQI